jgi:nucleoside-diphosphate-sugar epimerase
VLIEFIRTLNSPLVILGAGGKMGPTLALLARRAADVAGHDLEIIAVNRFHEESRRQWLEERGIRTLRRDLLTSEDLKRLPDAKNLVYLVGMKFGTMDRPSLTWAINALIPALICQRYSRSRIVALSTGNVYPLVPVDQGGALETNKLNPVGEYAMSCLARERVFEYYSEENSTPILLIRLNYALDLRYGVLVDIALRVYHYQPVDVTMGYLNCIWQGDANEMILRSLALAESPARALNLTSPEIYSVRELALQFGELMGRDVQIVGQEAESALLSNPAQACEILGAPPMPLERVMRWTADWVIRGGSLLDKPTHFEVSDGGF